MKFSASAHMVQLQQQHCNWHAELIGSVPIYYRPQRSCGKVIFSQASVGHSVHRGGLCPGEVSVRGGFLSRGWGKVSVWGGSLSRGWGEGLCLEGSLSGGVSLRCRQRPDRDPPPLYGNERAVRILLECILVEIATVMQNNSNCSCTV